MNQPTDPKDTAPDQAPTRMVQELPDPPETRPEAGVDATQALPARPPVPPPAKASGGRWLLWLIVVLLGLGAAAYAFLQRRGPAESAPQASAAPEAAPPELRPYLDQAKAGDAKAMHMIAVMYWNGLNVRQNRAKGLEWYKKAAAAGSTAAQKFLKDNQLQ